MRIRPHPLKMKTGHTYYQHFLEVYGSGNTGFMILKHPGGPFILSGLNEDQEGWEITIPPGQTEEFLDTFRRFFSDAEFQMLTGS